MPSYIPVKSSLERIFSTLVVDSLLLWPNLITIGPWLPTQWQDSVSVSFIWLKPCPQFYKRFLRIHYLKMKRLHSQSQRILSENTGHLPSMVFSPCLWSNYGAGYFSLWQVQINLLKTFTYYWQWYIFIL